MSYIVLLSALTVAGLLLLVFGLRGRRVGDTPHCRRCGYDLSGLADRQRCSECGTALDAPRDIVYGIRRRCRGVLWSGAVLLVIGAPLLILAGVTRAYKIDWYAYAPTWWLIDNVRDPANGAAAAAELRKRLIAEELAEDDLTRIFIGAARFLQQTAGDVSKSLWFDEAEIALQMLDGNTAPRGWDSKFIEGLYVVEVRTPPIIPQGERVEYEFEVFGRATDQKFSGVSHPLKVDLRVLRFSGGDVELRDVESRTYVGNTMRSQYQIRPGQQPNFPLGESQLEFEFELAAFRRSDVPATSTAPLHVWTVRTTRIVKVWPGGSRPHPCFGVCSETLDEWFVERLQISHVIAHTSYPDMQAFNFYFSGDGSLPPVPYAAKIEIRLNGEWRRLGETEFRSDQPLWMHFAGGVLPKDAGVPSVVDVRLSCNAAPWRSSDPVVDGWGGTLLYEDVQLIEQPEPAPFPIFPENPAYRGRLAE